MRYKVLLTSVRNRLVADYVRKLDLQEYERLLSDAGKLGYQIMSLREFYTKISATRQMDNKYFLNRHDVDIDLKTAKRMFKIEKKMGITSTFYFRLSTLDIPFMQKIRDYGSEVGYHFEEIATFAKTHRVKDKESLRLSFVDISTLFLENLERIEASIGFKIYSVASHGDFVNRALGCTNNEIISEALKRKGGIEFEAYELTPYFDK